MGHYLIIGATGGTGAATARRLVEQGHSVHLMARDASELSTLSSELDTAHTVADVAADDFADRVRAAAQDGVDGLVYAVGTINLKASAKLTITDFQRDMQINAFGAAVACEAARSGLEKGDGPSAIVLYSSVAARQGFAQHVSISMAKGAIEGLTVALAAEYAPKIRVNAVAPSLVDTKIAKGLTQSPQLAKAIAGMHAIPRLGSANDTAALTTFLVGPDAGWITGQVFAVDGGRSSVRAKG